MAASLDHGKDQVGKVPPLGLHARLEVSKKTSTNVRLHQSIRLRYVT
jgi:hypothetical protein